MSNEEIKQLEVDDRIKIIIDASSRIIVLFDNNLKVIYCNPAALNLMGFQTKEEFIAGFIERTLELTPKIQSDGRQSESMYKNLTIAAEKGHNRFYAELCIDGKFLSYDVEMKKIPYKDNFGIVTFITDITETRKHEIELIRSREQNELQLAKLNLVVKATKIGLWDMEVNTNDPSASANTIRWSEDFRKLLGFNDENDFPDLIGSFHNVLHPDDIDRTNKALEKHLFDKTGKTPFDLEYRVRKKTGEYTFFHAMGETVRDEEGNPIRIAGAIMDITETKNLIQEAERQRFAAESANKAKSDFLSTMSHEIRTPLNAILGITEIELMNEKLGINTKESLDKIYTSGDLLLSIINDILDLSKIEAGKLELLINKYDVASLISDTAQLNMMRIGSKQIEFELNIDENIPAYMYGDELRIKQILNNLLSNAFKYTDKGTVKLSVLAEINANADDVTLVFVVSDTGHGMTKEQIDKLFDEYARFNQDSNNKTEGTGLGMSITRNLVFLMSGIIEVESEKGKGSVFTVRIPQRKGEPVLLGKEMAENLQRFRAHSKSQMKKVLISRELMPYGSVLVVDDVDTNLYVARGLLVPYGLKVDTADSGTAAIGKVKEGTVYDIIFMDHMMPEIDGIEATKIIRGMGYDQPIVALTANAVAGQADTFLKNGFNDFISKPIDIRQMNNVLNKLIRDKQPPEVLETARKMTIAEKVQDLASPRGDSHLKEIFISDANKTLSALSSIIEKGSSINKDDLKIYIIHIHGIKTALANMEKMDLFSAAKKLEQSGRDENIGVIVSETPVFLKFLREFKDKLSQEIDESEGEKEEANRLLLHDELLIIRKACGEYDEETVDKAITELRKKTWSKEDKDLLIKISENILHSDFDETVELINKYLDLNRFNT